MSNLSAFPYITEGSEATPGLWNAVYSVLSANLASINTDLSTGHFQFLSIGSTPPSYKTTAAITIAVNSNQSDYFYLTDSAAQRSSYVIGSRAGGTADGLNIWDVSGATMIVSFSKQSIRFYQNVTGPVFDTGGALAGTYNAATFIGSGSSLSGIQAAINQASIDNIPRVYLPASMYPYSASSISFINTVQMVREGANWEVYDVKAYGAFGNGSKDDLAALRAAAAGAGVQRRTVVVPDNGIYQISSSFSLPVGVVLVLGTGTIRSALTTTLIQLNTYSGIIGFGPGAAALTITASGSGAGITSATTGVQVGDCVLRGFLLTGGGSNQTGSIGIDMSGIKETVVQDVGVQSFSSAIHGSQSGGATCYWNHFEDVMVYDAILGYSFWNSANEQLITGGSIRSTRIPLSAISISGLVMSKPVFEGYSVSGPVFQNTNYAVYGARLETTVSGLTTWSHDANCAGALLHPTLAGNATEQFTVGNDAFSYLRSGLQVGNPPVGLSLLDGDIVAKRFRGLAGNHRLGDDTNSIGGDAVWEMRRSGVTREDSIRWYTGGTLKWYLGTGVADNSDNLALYDNQAGATAVLVDIGTGNFRFGSQVMTVTGSANTPGYAFSSESSLGWYRSGASTMALSYGTLNLSQSRLVSVRTTASLDSTTLATNEMAFSLAPGSSGASLAIRSGGTIYYFSSSNSTKG